MITTRALEYVLMTAFLVLAAIVPSRVWAADGARVVFGGTTLDGRSRIYTTTPEGVGFEPLTIRDASANYPVWSHDGHTIALTYSPFGEQGGIYLMDPDGSDLRALAAGPPGFGWRPTWSPTDDAVAFESSRLGFDRRGIYVVDLNGGPEARVTDRFESSRAPSWSPVSDAIAYTWRRDDGFTDIRAMDRDGLPLGQLTDRPWYHAALTWHPRGKAIAFGSRGEDDDNADIYIMQPDGTGTRRVTTHPAEDSTPVWSPDGAQILFESSRDGSGHMYIMDLSGRIVRRVTDSKPLALVGISGVSWFDPAVPRGVSPIDRAATTWGWLRQLASGGRKL